MFKLFDSNNNGSGANDLFMIGICNCVHDSCECTHTCGCDQSAELYEQAPSISLHNRVNAARDVNRRVL